MSGEDMSAIGIIGAGRLGAALAAGLRTAGYRVAAVASRTRRSADELALRLDAGAIASEPQEAVDRCDLVFLTVPDDAIGTVAGALRWRAGQAAVHCSGALGLDALAPAAAAGALTGCLHPIQSFPSRAADPARFRGIVCGVEGVEPLRGRLEGMARDLGAGVVRLEGIDRARYHAAAVFVSNYAVALMAAAARVWEAAGLPANDARRALAPLLLGTAGSIAEQELAEALTGPLARGDAATIERHLTALAAEPELRELYRLLGAELLRLRLDLGPEAAARIRELLRAP